MTAAVVPLKFQVGARTLAAVPRRPAHRAVADRVRAAAPVAYLACTADGLTLRYGHVGHDPVLAVANRAATHPLLA